VMAGEGVGWLRVGRLKKLLEDESYRVMLVVKINKTFERKVGPDDHVDDVVSMTSWTDSHQPQLRSLIIIYLIKVRFKASLERNAETTSAACQWS